MDSGPTGDLHKPESAFGEWSHPRVIPARGRNDGHWRSLTDSDGKYKCRSELDFRPIGWSASRRQLARSRSGVGERPCA